MKSLLSWQSGNTGPKIYVLVSTFRKTFETSFGILISPFLIFASSSDPICCCGFHTDSLTTPVQSGEPSLLPVLHLPAEYCPVILIQLRFESNAFSLQCCPSKSNFLHLCGFFSILCFFTSQLPMSAGLAFQICLLFCHAVFIYDQ